MKLKIGWIDYLNTLPFNFEITGFLPSFDYQLVKGEPSSINKLIQEGRIDTGFISSAEYIENFEKYLILPDLSISSVNRVYSVLILSDIPVEEIEEIHLTKASKTSRYLTRIVFEIFYKKNVIYRDLESIERAKSVLLIGDNAIRYRKKYNYCYDLSGIWFEKTKLPFVFALWCVREDISEKKKREILEFHKILKLSQEKFFKDIKHYLELYKTDIDREFASEYLENLNYQLKKEHIKSLELFSEYLLRLGIINKKPVFRFVK